MKGRLAAIVVGVAVLLIGCGPATVIREADVYRVELEHYDRWAVRQAELLRDFVSTECVCAEGLFEETRCDKAADWLLTVEARHAWHRQMALFNAGLVDERPDVTPPQIPPSTCPLPPGPNQEETR